MAPAGTALPWLLAEGADMGAANSVSRSRLGRNASSSPLLKCSNDTHLLWLSILTSINALLNALGSRRQNQFKDTFVKPPCRCCTLQRSHHGDRREWSQFGSSQLSRVVSVDAAGFQDARSTQGMHSTGQVLAGEGAHEVFEQ